MLQFMTTLCTTTTRLTSRSSWLRFTALIAHNSTVGSNKSATSIKEKKLFSVNNAFSKRFETAKSINDLLDLATIPNLSTSNALKLISSITNQINSGKTQTDDIESDERFIHLRKLVKNDDNIEIGTKLSDDLLQYSQLSTPAMIEMIALLREQKKRNTPLLRLLSYNIVKYNVKLDLKQCATLLYSMAVLNFPDKVLLEKVMCDLLECIPNSTSAVTNRSIITALGILYYKNEDVLNAFYDTMCNESINYKYLDYFSILQTFAALRYKPEKMELFIEKFTEKVNPFQGRATEPLDIVWCLAILDMAQSQHVELLLKSTFLADLFAIHKISVSKILKLININAVGRFLLKDYSGPVLNANSEIFMNVPLKTTKGKQIYVDALSETLSKLLPSTAYFKTNINTNMGFLLDAEYRIDGDDKLIKVENWDEQSENVKRIAIMVFHYHDYCRGQNDLRGYAYLYTQLLKARGYELITISYENFSIQDKIEKRMYYLKQHMQNVSKIQSI